MTKKQALEIIKDAIHTDILLGWSDHLIDLNILEECKISQIEDMKQCWEAGNLQDLLNKMTA